MPALFLLVISLARSQEALVSDHSLKKADVIVIGTLARDYGFPWFDGWNERGHIRVERILKGNISDARVLKFAWERDFQPGWCLTRPDWRGAIGKRGIWLLTKDSHLYRSPDLFGGYLEPDKHLKAVIQFLSEANGGGR
jgi:hypothetical protein